MFSNLEMGSMFLMRHIHLTWYCASSPDSNCSLYDKSFIMLSNQLYALGPSPPSPPLYCRISFFSLKYIPLQPTFLHFEGHFSHIRCPSNSLISYSIQQSKHLHFRHIQLLLLCVMHCTCVDTVHQR